MVDKSTTCMLPDITDDWDIVKTCLKLIGGVLYAESIFVK